MTNEQRFFYFITERHAIYKARVAGQPRPWTKDKILRTYRFTNVYREHDAVTQWLAEHWRTPHAKDPDLWFAMVIARIFNEPATLKEIDWPVPYDRNRILLTIQARKLCKERNFNPAYIVSTCGRKMPKELYVIDLMLKPLWHARLKLRPQKTDTLQSYYQRLSQFQGLGSFMTAQVIADLKYVAPLKNAKDWFTFAASGPGSRRGLNRLLGQAPTEPWTEAVWRQQLGRLQRHINVLIDAAQMKLLHAQDLQNCLCEWDKYERTRLGQGRPKQKFNGG